MQRGGAGFTCSAVGQFRQTERFPAWRAAIGPFFAGPPRVEHYTDVV